ncbi:hypothetical protein ERX27_07660 [Macrococcus brunensis]|uniref:Uncharacterized protein n=1 Tax=Macrococcus brunensis TaxID=198483 RepID=A0A4R6BD53_9STAP|nr:hypothetical protein [Macrococcus brunensis]TDL96722.1 hypothetical protein ERX27_07660 [Macrococcus brunensis]
MEKIIGVAGFIDDFKVIISAGNVDGIQEGMELSILSSKGEDIRDPFSGEILGRIPHIKAMIKVILVQDRFSICVIKDQYLPAIALGNANISFFKQRFKFEGKPIERMVTDEPIKVGDIVEI